MINTVLCLILLLSCSTVRTPKIEEPIKLSIRTTAYTHSESSHGKYGRKTALGTTLKSGIIATDWSKFPIGTILKINERLYTVEDYGSALIRSETSLPVVDVYVTSVSAMNKWGRKTHNNVEIIKMGDYNKSAKILKTRLKNRHCRLMYERIQKYL